MAPGYRGRAAVVAAALLAVLAPLAGPVLAAGNGDGSWLAIAWADDVKLYAVKAFSYRGSIYVVGWVEGVSLSRDAFIARFEASSGRLLWARSFGQFQASDEAYDVKASSDGTLYVVGVTVYNGERRLFVARFSPGGELMEFTVFDGAGGVTDTVRAAATVAADGGLYVAACSDDSVTILKYHGGRVAWARYAYSSYYSTRFDCDSGVAAASDGSGGVYFAGSSYDDFYLLKLNWDGDVEYSVHMSGSGRYSVADAAYCHGSLYVAGYTEEGYGSSARRTGFIVSVVGGDPNMSMIAVVPSAKITSIACSSTPQLLAAGERDGRALVLGLQPQLTLWRASTVESSSRYYEFTPVHVHPVGDGGYQLAGVVPEKYRVVAMRSAPVKCLTGLPKRGLPQCTPRSP